MLRGFTVSRIVVFVLVFTIATISLCFAQFAGGTGTVAAPYQVDTAAQLNIVRSYPAAHFVQTADIDLGIAPYNTGVGWAPIATQAAPFTGTYLGNGYKILNLFINRPTTNYQGLFAYTSNAEIQQVQLENASVIGKDYTGALLGCAWNTAIQKSSATGTIAGAALVGGLLGSLEGGSTIIESYANCTTSGQTSIGGLLGYSKGSSLANACYSRGKVNGTNAVGGLIGTQGASVSSYCYSAAVVTGSWAVGGLLGLNDTASQINYCYAYGLVSGTSSVGGLVGRSVQSQTANSYWNTQTSTQTSSAGGIGSSTDDMNYPYAASTFVGWDFSGLWREDTTLIALNGYPYLSWQYTPPVIVDLAVSGFTCPSYSAVGMQTNIRVQVISNSTNPQSGYQVKLYQEGGIELLSQNGNPIDSGETLEYIFDWTPTAIGSVNLYAVVVQTGDQDSTNDQSAMHNVQVFAAGTISLTIGTGDQTGPMPMNMYWKNCLYEVVIPASELGFMGHINQLDFYNTFITNLPNMPTRIWLGETVLSDLSAGWIPSTLLSQVFDGNVSYPSGINTISIPLQVPYNYQGGNLVMLVQRPMESVYYSSSDRFYCQTVGTNRARNIYSDSTTYDPANPGYEGTLSGQYPKTTFHVFGDYILSPPRDLTAAYSLGDDWLNLAWDAPLNGSPVSYNVYRNGALLQSVAEPGFEDTGLEHGSSYSYAVTAVFESGESAATEAVSVTVYKRPLSALCVYPTDGAVNISFQPEFAWTPNPLEGFPQPDGYEFHLWTADEPTVLSTVFLADQTSFAILDVLLPETPYFWKLTPYLSTPDRNGDNSLGLNSLAETRERSVLYAQDCPVWSFTTKAAIALTLTPASWDFGDVLISTSAFQDFSCGNIGAFAAIISAVYLTGDSLGAFSLDTATPPVTIEPMGSLSVRVYFNPLFAGVQNVSLVLVDGDGDLHTISISGTGFAEELGNPVNLTANLDGWTNVALNWEMDFTPRTQMDSGKSELALNSIAETNQRSLQYFNIYRNAELLATSTAPYYYDDDLQDGWYEYYVTAVFQTFMSEPSNTVGVEIFTILPPQNLSAALVDEAVQLNWAASLAGFETGYNLWRLQPGQEYSEANWTLLIENTTEPGWMDNVWSDLPGGSYLWAVKAGYADGITSAPVFSNVLVKETLYPVINVSPGSISYALSAGDSLQLQVVISNSGTAQLVWDSTITDMPYKQNRLLNILLSPPNGIVQPDSSQVCILNINPADAPLGMSYYQLEITSNDHDNPMVTIPITIEVISAMAYIPDDNFRMAINEALEQEPEYQPTIADLNGFTGNLVFSNKNISSIEGAQYFVNISQLSLEGNQISDLSPLSGLTNLNSVVLATNLITDLSPLSSLTYLYIIDARNNQVSNISSLAGFAYLGQLALGNNLITNISPLSGLMSLLSLSLESNQITDFNPLSGLINLQQIDLRFNSITNISSLSGLSNLQAIYLSDNQISDLSPLSGLPNLQYLELMNNQIIDSSPLSGLTSLQNLELSNNQISDLNPLSGMANLQILVLRNNLISDLSPLSGLANLQYLWLSDNTISDISPLSGFTTLMGLYLASNPLSKESMLLSQSWSLPYTASSFTALAPCYPEPDRNATNVPIYSGMAWQGNYDSQTAVFEVFLGNSPQSLEYLGDGFMVEDTYYAIETNLQPLTQYYWRVKAIADTVQIWSGMWSFTTGEPVYNPPLNVTAINDTLNAYISWDNPEYPSNPTGYQVWSMQAGQESNEANWVLISETTSNNTATDPQWKYLSAGSYKWAVKAIYAGSNYSAPAFSNELQKTDVIYPDGLVRYYPFNGNADDASAAEQNATIHGAVLTPDRFGNPDSAYYFNGVSDYLVANANGLPTAERTVALWFKAPEVDSRPVMIGYGGSSGGTSWFEGISHWGNNAITLSCHNGVNTLTYNYATPPVGQWYHLAISTSNEGTKMYLNGILVASNSTFINDTFVADRDLAIGVCVSPGGFAPYTDENVGYFTGSIDDVRIYNRALSNAEIQGLLNLNDFAGGTGTEADPFLVATAEHLNNVRNYPTAHFKQVADINLGVEPWTLDTGWEPIGNGTTYFMGTYDGDGYAIDGLYINRPGSYNQGLFVYCSGATLEHIGLTNLDVNSGDYSGGLVGYLSSSTIDSCYSSGSVSGSSSSSGIGGLVGMSYHGNSITNSHSTCTVSGYRQVGGLVGYNYNSNISDSYNTGTVTGTSYYIGGLVGYCYGNSRISNCYSSSVVTGTTNVGGLVGYNYESTVTNSYWDTETSGILTGALGEGRTTTEMTYPYASNTYVGWDFASTWAGDLEHSVNGGYPYLQWQAPTPEFYPPQHLTASEMAPDVMLTWRPPLAGTPESYQIWRLQPAHESDEASWTLVSGAVSDTTATDPQWGYLADGIYKWAVKAMYAGGVFSAASFSNELEKTTPTAAIITVNPDLIEETISANGVFQTEITLQNQGDAPLLWTSSLDVRAVDRGTNANAPRVSAELRAEHRGGDLPIPTASEGRYFGSFAARGNREIATPGSTPNRSIALYLEPNGGTIQPDSLLVCTLNIDSSDSPNGLYTYQLVIASNAVNSPELIIPISISVSGGTPAYIPDDNFRMAINEALGQATYYQPTIEDLQGIYDALNADSRNIVNLEGAQHLVNLQGLYLEINQISDLSPLSTLTNLYELRLGYNQISDLSPLSAMTNLQSLDLHNNQISDISPLSTLANLQYLFFWINQVSDLSPLSTLTNLHELNLGYNQVSDLSPLSTLTNMQWLDLGDNQISDLSPLSAMTNLQWLYLYGNQISDINPLAGLYNLDYLYLDNNPLSKESMLQTQSWDLPYTTSSFTALAPCYPEPDRNATNVPIYSSMAWQGNYDSQTALFEVYLGKSPQSLAYLGDGFMVEDTYYAIETNLQPLSQYYWRVKAIAGSQGIWSGMWSFTTGEVVYNPPLNVTAVNDIVNAYISWDNPEYPSNPTGYQVWSMQAGQESNEANWVLISETTSNNTATDPQWVYLSNGSYKWAVKAMYAGSIYSAPAFSNELLKAAVTTNTAPVVSNVTAVQRDDASMLMDIYYDVYDADGDSLSITMQVSDDDGLTWNLSCAQIMAGSDIGGGIYSGTGKHIIWDVATEHPNIIGTAFRFRISAEDGVVAIPENFVLVEGGTFNNGTSDVTLSSFYLDKYELTQAGYQAVMGTWNSDPYGYGTFGIGSTYPVYYVSWFDAIEYCNRRSMQEGLTPCYSYSSYGTNPDTWPTGWNTVDGNHANVSCNWTANGYRLPTEAEWEFAARGGNQTHNYTYSGSNDINAVAWYWDNSSDGTKPVGGKLANELGLYDMSGNVWEWNWDIDGVYPSGSQNNPTGATSGSYRVLRGGSWYGSAYYCTVSYRNYSVATYNNVSFSFRLCRVSP